MDITLSISADPWKSGLLQMAIIMLYSHDQRGDKNCARTFIN